MADGTGVDPGELLEALAGLKEQVVEAAEQVGERLELERRMREHPWAVLGIAAGAGFVLGGGLWPALRPMVKAAGRAALSPANLLALAAALGVARATSSDQEEAAEPAAPTEH